MNWGISLKKTDARNVHLDVQPALPLHSALLAIKTTFSLSPATVYLSVHLAIFLKRNDVTVRTKLISACD